MNTQVLEAIKRSAAVPSVPQVVTRFLEVIQDPNFDYEDLATVLSSDPGTVSEILRLTNSALFGVARKITSLRQALTMLGPKRTRSLVLGRYLVESIGNTPIPGLDASYFWRRSLATAVLAARFANTVAPRQAEEVFICGLLADIGIPVLAQALPQEYKPVVGNYAPHGTPCTDDQEREAVGVTHGEVSAMVLSYWGLPETIATAVNCHHTSLTGDDAPAIFARLIGASDRIAKLLCEIPDIDDISRVCNDAAELIGLDIQTVAQVIGDIQDHVEDLASVLHIDVLPSSVYAMIAQAIQETLTTTAQA